MCGDGSLRNAELNMCFTKKTNKKGISIMASDICHLTPIGINEDQKFKKGLKKSFMDEGGMN